MRVKSPSICWHCLAIAWRAWRYGICREGRCRTTPVTIIGLVECIFLDRGRRWTASADPLTRNFHTPSEPVPNEGKVYRTTKLEWDKLANYSRSVTGSAWGCDKGTAYLLPVDGEARLSCILYPPPFERYAPTRDGKCSVFCGVGGQLMQNHRHCLGSFCFQGNVWANDLRISRDVGCELAADNF